MFELSDIIEFIPDVCIDFGMSFRNKRFHGSEFAAKVIMRILIGIVFLAFLGVLVWGMMAKSLLLMFFGAVFLILQGDFDWELETIWWEEYRKSNEEAREPGEKPFP